MPITEALLDRYVAWLAHEHREALVENATRSAPARVPYATHPLWSAEGEIDFARRNPPMYWFPNVPEVERIVASRSPSTRAAVVLSAAEVELPHPSP